MFWDRVAGVYDLFANYYNAGTHRVLCKEVASLVSSDDEVLECACGTGLLTRHIAPACKHIVATDFSEKMLDRVCRKGGRIIIPTYMNREKEEGRTSGFATAVGKAGADFKRQFTFSSYRQFFSEAGYKDVSFTMIEGRVPCAVAVLSKNG